jgi:hypothetical protein
MKESLFLGIVVAFGLCACGGTVTVNLGTDPDEYELIDDMEHPNEVLPQIGGRSGFWAVYNDGNEGTQWPKRGGLFAMSPVSPARGSSNLAARTYGSGFTNPMGTNGTGWALISVAFVSPARVTDGGLPVYDASHYRGVRFWARIGSPDVQNPVRLALDDLQTDPSGGQCEPTTCYNRFGTNLLLTTEWTQVRLLFRDFQQNMTWGKLFDDIDIEHVFSLSFNFQGSDAFDLWIDDLEFIKGDYPGRATGLP